MMERLELAPDSCGPGRNRGGLGPDFAFHFLEDTYVISTLERTKNAPWGLAGGQPARPNGGHVRYPDGREEIIGKKTGVFMPKGTVFTISCGGGGGYGPPSERPKEKVLDDLREGYITEAHAREHYPHAFED
jgi:N-methylhydantoinase B